MSLTDIGPLDGLDPVLALLSHPVWQDIEQYFKPREFLRLLFRARVEAEVPFRILDTLRDDSRSAHGERPGIAVDLQVLNSRERSRVVRGAFAVGFIRVGVYEGSHGIYKGMQKKDGGGVHLDASRTKSSDHMWTMRLP